MPRGLYRGLGLLLLGLLGGASACYRPQVDVQILPRPMLAIRQKIELGVEEMAGLPRRQEPVAFGMPFPRGALYSVDNLRLVDAHGDELPTQRQALALWPEGSLRWVLIESHLSLAAREQRTLYLEFGKAVRAGRVASGLVAFQDRMSGRVEMDTGALRLAAGGERPSGLLSIKLDLNGDGRAQEEIIALPGLSSRLLLGKALAPELARREFRSDRDNRELYFECFLEEAGPLRATLLARGWHYDEQLARAVPYLLRLSAYRGQGYLKLSHTFIWSERERAISLQELSLLLPVAFRRREAVPELTLLARSESLPAYPDFVTGETLYTLRRDGKVIEEGVERNWLTLSDGHFTLGVALRNVAEEAPKSLAYLPRPAGAGFSGEMVIGLVPPEGALDFRTPRERKAAGWEEFTRTEGYRRYWQEPTGSPQGWSKTHEILLAFYPGEAEQACKELAGALSSPLLVRAPAGWYSRCGVFGNFAPREKASATAGAQEKLFLDWLLLHQARFGWRGMLDHGDFQSVYGRKGDLDIGARWWNWHGEYAWLRLSGGARQGLLTAHLGAADPQQRELSWRLFEASSRHGMDVDTVHYAPPREDRTLGFGRAPGVEHWSGSAHLAARYTCSEDFLAYYYLTGSRRAREVVDLAAHTLASSPITSFKLSPDLAHDENQAGYLRGLLAGWELTGEEMLRLRLEEALAYYERLTERELAAGNVWGRGLASALIRWHALTGDERVRKLLLRASPALRAVAMSTGSAAASGAELAGLIEYWTYLYRLNGRRRDLETARELREQSAVYRAWREKRELSPDTFQETALLAELYALRCLEAGLSEAGGER